MHERAIAVWASAVFILGAAVTLSFPDLTPFSGPEFGPGSLPFRCDFTRQGAGPDDMEGRFTLQFDRTRPPPFPHCATLTRGTEQRPRRGTEQMCFDHVTLTPQSLWRDPVGGSLSITRDDGAIYTKRERAPGVPITGPFSTITYTGSCED